MKKIRSILLFVTLTQATLAPSESYRGAYYKNGEIHVNTFGTPEGTPLTEGHADFKPSWSKTGDMLVFFRRLKNDPVVVNWITQICVIHTDGTGFHTLTDGTHTDFNQTWTRDGSNTPIWNRRNPASGRFFVVRSAVGAKPGDEQAITDPSHHSWAYTCLKDGRILVQSHPPNKKRGYYLLTPDPTPKYEWVVCDLANQGLLDRLSLSTGETRICFEYQQGWKRKVTGRTLYMADFDAKSRTISNPKVIANKEGKPQWYAYPRWTRDEKAIVYHAAGQLYMYEVASGSTRTVSAEEKADYRYPHLEGAPK